MTGRTDAWMYDGTPRPCADDPELWFSNDRRDQVKARARCLRCPLLGPCRTYALTERPAYGMWGGITETARRRTAVDTTDCGTQRGYLAHRRQGQVCEECEAWRAADLGARRHSQLADEHAKGGTPAGYQIHLRLGESPCRDCRAADLARGAAYRAAKRAKAA